MRNLWERIKNMKLLEPTRSFFNYPLVFWFTLRATENEKEITFLYDFLKLLFTLMELFVSIIYLFKAIASRKDYVFLHITITSI